MDARIHRAGKSARLRHPDLGLLIRLANSRTGATWKGRLAGFLFCGMFLNGYLRTDIMQYGKERSAVKIGQSAIIRFEFGEM
jgi:hypothetical protein